MDWKLRYQSKNRYVYRTQKIKPHTWEKIEEFYIDAVNFYYDFQRYVELVRHIRTSGLSDRLFAYTSLYNLNIGIYNPIELGVEVLTIQFDITTRKWHFFYCPKPFEPIEFERYYEADKGIEKFDQFIEMLKW